MKKWLATTIFVVFLAVIAAGFFLFSDTNTIPFLKKDTNAAELEEIRQIRGSFGDLGEYFANLAQEKGGVYAFSVLGKADLPPNIDVHLLGHIVGDELYKQEGLEGMQYCTPEFRNACSHTIVIGALLERGEGVFNSVHDVCKKAPGGSGAYTMCFHGFGHGVLAYADYEIPKAVEMCKRVGTEAYHDREYVECVGGSIMEMVSGVHDPSVQEEKAKKYLSEDDPLYICRSKNELIPKEAQPICYVYITPELFEASGAGIGKPDPDKFDEAFAYCDTIPKEETVNRDACFGGLGKEFIVLVQDRDVRDFTQMNDEQMRTVINWCDLAGNETGVRSCMTHAVNSLYWGAENPVTVPLGFCEQVDDEGRQQHCMDTLIQAVDFYTRGNRQYREDFCESIDGAYVEQCKRILL